MGENYLHREKSDAGAVRPGGPGRGLLKAKTTKTR